MKMKGNYEKNRNKRWEKVRTKPIGSGRKATGLVRNKALSLRLTEDERKEIYEILNLVGKGRINSLLYILRDFEKRTKNLK